MGRGFQTKNGPYELKLGENVHQDTTTNSAISAELKRSRVKVKVYCNWKVSLKARSRGTN